MNAEKVTAIKKSEGDGAEVNRLFPTENYRAHHDPFVLLDEFFVRPPNEFAPHEHRGFEAITYMLEGHFVHEDNLGNKARVGPGGIQAFNAGRGITHSEKPGSEGLSRGIQLWVNLPESKKNSEPAYQAITSEQLKEEEKENLLARKIAGAGCGLKLHTEVEFLDIRAKNKTNFSDRLNTDQAGLVYLIEGEIGGGHSLQTAEGLLIEAGQEFSFELKADSRMILLKGKPHYQEIKLKGSFVE